VKKAAGCAVLLALLAGPAWAGDAWVADYAIQDAKGERTLVLVRDDNRVEYRISGEAPRIWRRLQDGVEMRELHPEEKRVITYSPGDLRTLGMPTDWEQLAGIVEPGLRTRLSMKDGAKFFGQASVRYTGSDPQGNKVMLDWLAGAGLPVHYCVGGQCAAKRDAGDGLRLRSLKQVPAEQAFSSEEGLLEIDQADLGDMEMDPVVRHLTHG
jgi:hypothetical protein